MPFNKALRRLRKQDKLTQADLAAAIGVSKSTISMYECGNREPDFETLEALADFFNVDMNELTGTTLSTMPVSSGSAQLNLSDAERTLVRAYRSLNTEGQEKLLDYADDMVRSGKYIKISPLGLGKKA